MINNRQLIEHIEGMLAQIRDRLASESSVEGKRMLSELLASLQISYIAAAHIPRSEDCTDKLATLQAEVMGCLRDLYNDTSAQQ